MATMATTPVNSPESFHMAVMSAVVDVGIPLQEGLTAIAFPIAHRVLKDGLPDAAGERSNHEIHQLFNESPPSPPAIRSIRESVGADLGIARQAMPRMLEVTEAITSQMHS